ncbi:MAG: hypothetical protein J0M08_11715 [Bacteroidetes bacterium]|nr:hypothetical protein [Bacteroidota bacterium]
MIKNKVLEVGILVFIAAAVLTIFSIFPFEYQANKFTIKPINLFSDITLKGQLAKAPTTPTILTDSIIKKFKHVLKERDENPCTIIEFTTDSISSLSYFFTALNEIKTKKKKARIGYFGDSMIEGDLITQDLRKLLQDKFGGDGIGFVPITSIVAGFRQTVIHTFSENWRTYNLLDAPNKAKLGISGYGFEPLANPVTADSIRSYNWGSWVKYTAVKQPHLNNFKSIKMYYGVGGDKNYMFFNDTPIKLSGTNTVNEAIINTNSGLTSVKASFNCSKAIPIYGFSMESDSGIFVDNFSFRGNSGMPLTKISPDVFSGMNNYLNYDLIVLQYGINVVNKNVTDYSWYEKGMIEVINHIKKAMPNTSILLISTSDRAIRQNGVYTTDPAIPILVESQKRIAQKTNCAFWNLYQSMGGANSMVKWAQADTALANKDYTHFNFRGAKKVAELLYTYLMEKYDSNEKKNVETSLTTKASL